MIFVLTHRTGMAMLTFYSLEEKYGREFMERIFFHIAAFNANTLVSLCSGSF